MSIYAIGAIFVGGVFAALAICGIAARLFMKSGTDKKLWK